MNIVYLILGTASGNVGPRTEVCSMRSLRLTASRPCNGTNREARYASECCPACEAREALAGRSEFRTAYRERLRKASKGVLSPFEESFLREFGAGSFYLPQAK